MLSNKQEQSVNSQDKDESQEQKLASIHTKADTLSATKDPTAVQSWGDKESPQQWGTSTRSSRESYSYMVGDILKGRQTLQLKWINFIVCKLFLDSIDENIKKYSYGDHNRSTLSACTPVTVLNDTLWL